MFLLYVLSFISFSIFTSELPQHQYRRVLARYIDNQQAIEDWKNLSDDFETSWNTNLRNYLIKNKNLLPDLRKYMDLHCQPHRMTKLYPLVPLFLFCGMVYTRYNGFSELYTNLNDGFLFISLLLAIKIVNHKERLLERKRLIHTFLQNPSGLEGPTYEIEGIVPENYYITYVVQEGFVAPNTKPKIWKRPSLGPMGNV
jgi:hypothetical protein